MRFLIHTSIVALALWLTTQFLSGVTVSSVPVLIVGAIVLGFVNALVRPILTLLTLPLTILTLGLFYLVVNGLAFGLAAALVPGWDVASFGSAILGALAVSVISWIIGGLLGE